MADLGDIAELYAMHGVRPGVPNFGNRLPDGDPSLNLPRLFVMQSASCMEGYSPTVIKVPFNPYDISQIIDEF